MKLVQKQFLKASREFEIDGDAVHVRLKSPFREEKLTVMLAVLDPEPVVDRACLEFRSRVKSDPLLSLLRDKPNRREFNAFVEELKRRAREDYNAFAGLGSAADREQLPGNVYAAPPDFDDAPEILPRKAAKPVDIESIDTAIMMLEQYLDADEIRPLLSALETLKAEPGNLSGFGQLQKSFAELGPRQGAVLTYAPYVGVLLSDNPRGYPS